MTMWRVAIACVVMVAAAQAAGPSFCRGLDCPVFTVLNSTDNYEVRMYNSSEWARTTVTDVNYEASEGTGFQRLFGYISGSNIAKEHVPMTAPVTVRCASVGGKIFSSKDFDVSFMVPFKFQPNPPRPSESNVVITQDPKRVVYVATYSGFSKTSDVVTHATQLAQALKADGVSFDADQFWTAGYDSPYQLFNRHNEIWYIAK